MKLEFFAESRIGGRQANQDRVGHWRTDASLAMVVADGMGGHARGELAAEVAVECFAESFGREARPRLEDPELFLLRTISLAHDAIVMRGKRLVLPDRPCTVLVACVVQEGFVYWTHVGDSRFYLIRSGRVLVRTRDHTHVQALVDAGRIREEAVAAHPDRNRVLRCLGSEIVPVLEPVQRERLRRGDVALLCSDGFWGPLSSRHILTALLSKGVREAIPGLMTLAETRGGPDCDNLSALAMAWGENADACRDDMPMARHELPTDVQDPAARDQDYMNMTDEDIGRAVEQIRDALRRQPRRP